MHSMLSSMLSEIIIFIQPTRWGLRSYFTSELMFVVVIVVAERVKSSLSP